MSKRGNPYHDPKNGQFTSGPGGGSGLSKGGPPHYSRAHINAIAAQQHRFLMTGKTEAPVGTYASGRASVAKALAANKARTGSVPAHQHFGKPTTTTPKTGDYNIALDPTRNGTYAPPGSGQKFANPGIHTIRGGRHRSR